MSTQVLGPVDCARSFSPPRRLPAHAMPFSAQVRVDKERERIWETLYGRGVWNEVPFKTFTHRRAASEPMQQVVQPQEDEAPVCQKKTAEKTQQVAGASTSALTSALTQKYQPYATIPKALTLHTRQPSNGSRSLMFDMDE